MTAIATVDARALASEGQKPQWAPTRSSSSLNARAVFAGENRRVTSPYAGEERKTAAAAKEAGFTGHRTEEALGGLISAEQRWLDPLTGTWMSRDPVGAASYLQSPNELNPWLYAAGNPTRFTDPDGRDAAECIRKGLRWEDQAWTTDSANCMTSSSPRKIELALRARDATSPSAVAKSTGDYLDYVNTDEMVCGTVGRPLFFATAAASGAGIGAGCAITPGCGAVALTAGAGGLAASPDPGAALMSPVRACGNALTSGAGDATAADAECGSALGGALFGVRTNSEFASQTAKNAKKLAFSPGAIVVVETPEGFIFLGLAEKPVLVSGATAARGAAAPFVMMAAATNPALHPSKLPVRIGKTEIVWPSAPHANETPGHWETIVQVAMKMAKSGKYKRIYVNKGINNELGAGVATPNNRPDVWGVRWDGKNDLVEVPSGTDRIPDLQQRMVDSQKKLGGGTNRIVPVDPKVIP